MDRYEQFLQERQYLLGVSPKTIAYYRWALNSYKKLAGDDPKEWVIKLRDQGVAATSVNTYICAMKTFWKWAGEKTRLGYLKEEQKILQTLSTPRISALLQYKPSGVNVTRAHAIALTIVDCDLRASELLSLRRNEVHIDNLVLKVKGEGGKHRLVPFSVELRKRIWYLAQEENPLIFGTRNQTQVSVRNQAHICRPLFEEGGKPIFSYTQMVTHNGVAKLYRSDAEPAEAQASASRHGSRHTNTSRTTRTSMNRCSGWRAATIQANVLLISGCQDNRLSVDGARNDLFTETLLSVWGAGSLDARKR